MNATVTKSAKKSVAKKPIASAKAKPAAKAAGKSSLKAVAGKLIKKLAGVLKPAAKTAKSAAKPVKKPGPANTKPAGKPASKAVKKPAAKTAAKPVAKSGTVKKATAPAKKAAQSGSPGLARPRAKQAAQPVAMPKAGVSVAKTAPKPAAPMHHKGIQSTVGMSSNKVNTRLEDRIEKTAVLKVNEVATKTTKLIPAIVTDGALLSEAQILKMSEKDYMNAAQLAFFKARLQQLERDLLRNAGETTEHLRETVLVPDPADRATIEEEHALELRTRDRERKLLKKVQQSIASIDSGDYGWCEETGEPIGVPRLLARPTATLSLEAQQRRELKQKLYGD
jgi:DnaK suppressor protein